MISEVVILISIPYSDTVGLLVDMTCIDVNTDTGVDAQGNAMLMLCTQQRVPHNELRCVMLTSLFHLPNKPLSYTTSFNKGEDQSHVTKGASTGTGSHTLFACHLHRQTCYIRFLVQKYSKLK